MRSISSRHRLTSTTAARGPAPLGERKAILRSPARPLRKLSILVTLALTAALTAISSSFSAASAWEFPHPVVTWQDYVITVPAWNCDWRGSRCVGTTLDAPTEVGHFDSFTLPNWTGFHKKLPGGRWDYSSSNPSGTFTQGWDGVYFTGRPVATAGNGSEANPDKVTVTLQNTYNQPVKVALALGFTQQGSLTTRATSAPTTGTMDFVPATRVVSEGSGVHAAYTGKVYAYTPKPECIDLADEPKLDDSRTGTVNSPDRVTFVLRSHCGEPVQYQATAMFSSTLPYTRQLKQQGSGLCAAVDQNDSPQGARVVLAFCADHSLRDRDYIVYSPGGDLYAFKLLADPRYCLDIANETVSQGGRVVGGRCTNHHSQFWQLNNAMETDGYFTNQPLWNWNSGRNLDTANGSTSMYAPVVQGDATWSTTQKWSLIQGAF